MAAPNACYDSEQRYPPPKCHSQTRVQMIDELIRWVVAKSKTTPVFWLHGTAGIGKSAIAQHIAERYGAVGVLAAAFFFSRSDPTRDSLERFVATISYQFCKNKSPLYETLRLKIIDAISSDPNIFGMPYENQLERLILEPCLGVETALQGLRDLPNLLVVDGLDECVDPSQQERALGILRTLLEARSLPKWIILICSRPEPQIRDTFAQAFKGVLRSFDMTKLEGLNRDIATYLVDGFSRIRGKYQRVLGIQGAMWPEQHIIDELVRRADKQIIFAVTVINYVDTRDEPPQDRLETVRRIFIGANTDSPYSALDTLYYQIMSTCYNWERVQSILRLLVTPHVTFCDYDPQYYDSLDWRSPAMIAQLLNLNETQVRASLDRLHSVLKVPDLDDFLEDEYDKGVYIAHATFTEFLVDPERSARFHTPRMSESEYCDLFVTFVLRTLSNFAQYYPPYHSTSFAAALSVWAQKLKSVNNYVLQHHILEGWKLCNKVTAPASSDLVDALSTFDPHPLMALMQSWGPDLGIDGCGCLRELLRDVVRWAESQQLRSLQCLTVRLEAFLSVKELWLAFPPDTKGSLVFHHSFETEALFWCGVEGMSHVLREIFPVIPKDARSPEPMVLSLSSSSSTMIVPENWIVVRLTKESAELCSSLPICLEEGYLMLAHDIRNNTRETVLLGWIEESDLIHLKELVKERLKTVVVGTDLRLSGMFGGV
ncbi:hypothetical protein VNI00_012704 [Paramarasmius palmivorus]|uniref:NACHT domain-containing protein n=1 Tax=Paramarasmius palmivorus TaxID=297713 RepID=A0AAW0C574_9AGAR